MKFIQLLLIVFYCVLVERALLIDCCLSEYNSLRRALVNKMRCLWQLHTVTNIVLKWVASNICDFIIHLHLML